ncbi:MAG: FHA domain-containing protein [Myxococcota bacterium]
MTASHDAASVGRVVPLLSERLVLGRGLEADFKLDDPRLSRRHAEVTRVGLGFVLVDLHSCNGTFVNGQRVSQHELRDGDGIRVGGNVLRFLQGTLEVAPPARSVADQLAHEVNNPLACIQSNLDYLRIALLSGELSKETFDEIYLDCLASVSRIDRAVKSVQLKAAEG